MDGDGDGEERDEKRERERTRDVSHSGECLCSLSQEVCRDESETNTEKLATSTHHFHSAAPVESHKKLTSGSQVNL